MMRRIKYHSPLVHILVLLVLIAVGCQSGANIINPTATIQGLEPTQAQNTLDPALDPRTATVSALLTRAAGSSQNTPDPQKTKIVSTTMPSPLPTKAITPKPTQPAVPGIAQAWSIQTGDLFYFGVSGDGVIYGLGSGLYAVISSEGQLMDTVDMDLSDCLRPNFFGGAGASDMNGASMWFMIQPDGFISSYARIGGHGPCIITPGSPPRLEKLEHGLEFTPYSSDGQPRPGPDVPQGFTARVRVLGNIFVQDTRRDDFDFFINSATAQAGFRNRNNGFSIIDLPSDLDLEKNLHNGSLEIKITPWDDVYIRYQAYDAIGNATTQTAMLVKYDGTSRTLSGFPAILETLWDRSRQLVAYDRIRIEQYYKSGSQLVRTNEDYQIVASYTLPTDLGIPGQTISLWVGHDHAMYVFDRHKKTLTKYLFTSDR